MEFPIVYKIKTDSVLDKIQKVRSEIKGMNFDTLPSKCLSKTVFYL